MILTGDCRQLIPTLKPESVDCIITSSRCILAGCPKGGTVLDPFCGSGTAGKVAYDLGREFIGIELNPQYVAIAQKRIGTTKQISLEGVQA